MRITDVEPVVVQVNQLGDWIFVLVHTDEGLVGLGEASGTGNDEMVLAALKQFKERLLGRDPSRIQAIWNDFHNLDAGLFIQTALSSIEQALWDILGQHLNVSIRTLFGGQVRDRLRLYANINRYVDDRSPAGFARAAQQAVAEGFTAIKIAPFDELGAAEHIWTGPGAAWQSGVERVKAVRATIGDEIELAVDCHRRMEVSEAIMVAEAVSGCSLFWFEEPVAHTFPHKLAQITETVPMTTASGEGIYALEGFRPFLTNRIVDVIMPDVKHNGGLYETKRIADATRLEQLLVSPHNASGPVGTAASAQVMSTVTNFLILEYAWGEVSWRADLLNPPERIEDGYLILTEGPGLGHRLNQATVEAHRRA